MTPEDLINETKECIELNTKKIEIIDKDIDEIKKEADKKIEELNQDRSQIVTQLIKDYGAIEKLEKLNNANVKVKSK
tara:strand:- start:408 stop:638 length:231 start_codon:yes stop_codon:yes gene_type:complete